MSYSVIIPSYQRPVMLERALKSVYAQTVQSAAIYLVIDEPENWTAYAFLKDFDDRIQVTFTGGGFGGAKARNVGLDSAEEDYVFFLDDDDEWLPTKIEKQIKLLEARPDAVGVTCGRTEVVVRSGKRVDVLDDEERLNRRVRAENLTGSFSQFGLRRLALPDIRLLDALGSAQDFEFYMRVSDHGAIAVVPECLILYYRHGEGSITGSLKNKLEAYATIDRLHCEDSSAYDRRYRKYRMDRVKLNSEHSLLMFMLLSVKIIFNGLILREVLLAGKYITVTVAKNLHGFVK